MKYTKRHCGFLALLVVILTSAFLSSCGLAEQRRKKEAIKDLFERYPTCSGDKPYSLKIYSISRDTLLIVSHQNRFYAIDKYGNRQEVIVSYRRRR